MSGGYPPHDHGQYPSNIPPHLVPYYVPQPAPLQMPGQLPPQIPVMPPEGYAPRPYHPLHAQSSAEGLNQAYYQGYHDPNQALYNAQQGQRGRRRGLGPEQNVKHRRTRSGCYTCRNRRVKCDETHPICERCQKGNRECIYPEPTSGTKSRTASRGKSSHADSASSADEHDEHDDYDEGREHLPPIPDEDELDSPDQPSAPGTLPEGRREPSKTPSLTNDKSPSPSTEGSIPPPRTQQMRPTGKHAPTRKTGRGWSDLPRQLQFYLKFFRTNISHHHYAFKYDGGDFLHTTYLDIAIKNDPLLYAVVGFAAYHHTLTKPNGKIQDFLGFYNKSVQLLRQALSHGQKHSQAIILTILQLAAFEEYLGDWVNLLGHQKAAYEMITESYTPQTIMQNETLRRIIQWYIRFDVFAGLMGGNETILSRDWFDACHKHYVQQIAEHPKHVGFKFEERIAYGRLLATDVALLFARIGKGQITKEEFGIECASLQNKFGGWYNELDPSMTDASKLIRDPPPPEKIDPDDIIDWSDPYLLYGGDLWTMNFTYIDFWSIDMMLKFQIATAQQRAPPPETMVLAKQICRMFAAIENCKQSPPGSILGAHASLAIATLFLPKDHKHIMWCRQKLAKIEQLGYIYPATLRSRMSDLWGEDLSHWWLPNDEGYPEIIRSIRSFIEDRTSAPRDTTGEDLRDMRGVFNALSLEDETSSAGGKSEGSGMDFTGGMHWEGESAEGLEGWSALDEKGSLRSWEGSGSPEGNQAWSAGPREGS